MNLTPREQAEVESALGLAAAPVEPSAALKASIMSQIAGLPQLPAETQVPDVSAPDALASRTRTAGPGSAQRKAQERWFSRGGTLLAAAAAAVLLFLGGTFVGSQLSNLNANDVQAQSLAVLVSASDLQRATSPVSVGGEATLVWSLDQRKSAILLNELPELPAGKTYQLWYIGAEGAVGAGTFESSNSATSWRVLDGKMSAGDAVGVTVEPAGGSKQPTSDVIVKLQS